MEEFYCGDIVDPGTHVSLEDVVLYYNILAGDVDQSTLTDVQKRLLNINNSAEYSSPDRDNLNKLYKMVSGETEPILCRDGAPLCCNGKTQIMTYGWDDETSRESVNGISVTGFDLGGFLCIDTEGVATDALAYPYGFEMIKKTGESIYGKITATGNLDGKDVVYLYKNGESYSGKITSSTGNFDNVLNYSGECELENFTI